MRRGICDYNKWVCKKCNHMETATRKENEEGEWS